MCAGDPNAGRALSCQHFARFASLIGPHGIHLHRGKALTGNGAHLHSPIFNVAIERYRQPIGFDSGWRASRPLPFNSKPDLTDVLANLVRSF
jgi:hypothetical protein